VSWPIFRLQHRIISTHYDLHSYNHNNTGFKTNFTTQIVCHKFFKSCAFSSPIWRCRTVTRQAISLPNSRGGKWKGKEKDQTIHCCLPSWQVISLECIYLRIYICGNQSGWGGGIRRFVAVQLFERRSSWKNSKCVNMCMCTHLWCAIWSRGNKE